MIAFEASWRKAARGSLPPMAPLLLASVLSACHASGDAPRIEPAVAAEGAAFFQRDVIDEHPPGGADCCTDVLALADVNGDGFGDVIVGAEQARGAGLVWYEFPTWQRHEIGRGQFTTDGRALDFDGDGDVDVVVGDTTTGIAWFEQRGADAWTKHVIGSGYTHDLAVADFNGDGKLDVVRTDKQQVEIWYADGSSYRREVILERKGEGLAVADLDRDGDIDILFSNLWLENRSGGGWPMHDIAPNWDIDTRIAVVDMNRDGRADVVLSGSEGEAGIAWFEAPKEPASGSWQQNLIEPGMLVGAHSLAVLDLDLDGDLDVVTGEMHTSPGKRILAYLQGPGGWTRVLIATHGCHNMMAGDLDADGDIDLVGKNYGGAGRFLELWVNRAAELRHVPPKSAGATSWRYRPLDPARPDYDRHSFGLIVGDVNSDRVMDVAAGGTLYLQAAGERWQFQRIAAAPGSDIIHMTTHSHFGMHDLLAVGEEWLHLVSATSPAGKSWKVQQLRRLPPGRTQGYVAGPRAADGSYGFFFTKGTVLFALTVPGSVDGPWKLTRLAGGVEEAGVAVADLDGDGDLDVVTVDESGRRILWLEATPAGRVRRLLGAGLHYFDRVAIADLNGDGRSDIVFTEETRDWDYNARVGWLEAPVRPQRTQDWRAHTIVTLRSANSLDVTDFDGDGDADVVVAEHTDMRPGKVAPDNFTGLFLNDGSAHWRLEPVETGPNSSHMGARSADLDGDGRPELISIGWEQSALHLWTRMPPAGDARSNETAQ